MDQLLGLQLLVLLVMLSFAVYLDLRERRIPNKVTVSGLLAGLVIGAFLEGGIPFEALGGAALALPLALSVFAFGGIGAGDAKLFTAVGAFVGPGGLLSVFLYGAVAGGVLALLSSIRRGGTMVLLVKSKNLVANWLRRDQAERQKNLEDPEPDSLPYGVAIAAGAVLTWVFPLSLTGGG
jgi:prepilin peptidase CpaA